MITIRPFRALRPTEKTASLVPSVPYDVISTEEARHAVAKNPNSFLRIVRSEVDFPDTQDPYAPAVYERARENLNLYERDGLLVKEQNPGVYIYRIATATHQQTGVVALSSVDDYRNGRIKIHEQTRPEKEQDRLTHIITTKTHTGPVFLAFRQTAELKKLIATETLAAPLCSGTFDDCITHTIWRASNPEQLVTAFQKLDCSYIADGHHRAASSARAADHFDKEKNIASDSHRFFLSALFPHDELSILPYNRVLYSSGKTPEAIIDAVSKYYRVEKTDRKLPDKKGSVCMLLKNGWYKLTPLKVCDASDPVAALDVSVLQQEVLAPVFGVEDPRTAKTIEFVGGIRGPEELEKKVAAGADAAFSMFPVSIEELFQIADSGKIMAPKSTWFEPKLRSGLLVHRFG